MGSSPDDWESCRLRGGRAVRGPTIPLGAQWECCAQLLYRSSCHAELLRKVDDGRFEGGFGGDMETSYLLGDRR